MDELVPAPKKTVPRVLIVGAGFGGLHAAKELSGEAVQVTVCDRLNYHLFQPLLYQVAMAGLSATDVAVPIRAILRARNVEVLLAEVKDFDLANKRVRFSDGDEESYDYLIIAAGAHTNYYGHDDWIGHAPGLKDLNDALEIRTRVLLAFEAAERAETPAQRRKLLTFVVIGGGPTGVELAGAIADLSRDILRRDFRHIDPADVRVILVEMANRILTPFDPPLSERAVDQLRELGVEVKTGTAVSRIDDEGVFLGDTHVPAATVLWAAGVAPSPLARALGAPLDRQGRVIVKQDCSIEGHPEVFVIGDMARFVPAGQDQPLAGISPVAIQEGRSVARNILRDGRGEPRVPFEYFDKGFMATIGRARAVAQIRKLRLWGLPAWLAWVFVHLFYLVGFRNRISVLLSWVWRYAMFKYSARLITGHPTPTLPAAPPRAAE
jgi:NADH:ubiquinone reductase (H+-translocating)